MGKTKKTDDNATQLFLGDHRKPLEKCWEQLAQRSAVSSEDQIFIRCKSFISNTTERETILLAKPFGGSDLD